MAGVCLAPGAALPGQRGTHGGSGEGRRAPKERSRRPEATGNGQKAKAYSTRYSQAVSHPSTNQARPCLASEIRRDRARSGWYGRRRRRLPLGASRACSTRPKPSGCRASPMHAPACLPACLLPAWLPPPSAAGPGRVAEAAQEDPGKALWRKPRPSPIPGLLQSAPGLAPRPPPLPSRTAPRRTAPHRVGPLTGKRVEASVGHQAGRAFWAPPPPGGFSAPPPQSQGERSQPRVPSAPRERPQPEPAALAGPGETPGTLGMRARGRAEVRDPGSPGLWRSLSLWSRCPAPPPAPGFLDPPTQPPPSSPQAPAPGPRSHRTPPNPPLRAGTVSGKVRSWGVAASGCSGI